MPLAEAYGYASEVMTTNMLAAEAEEGIGAFIASGRRTGPRSIHAYAAIFRRIHPGHPAFHENHRDGGASGNDMRPSYFAMKYLLDKGFTIRPVNPGLAGKEILGQKVYVSLHDVPAPVDLVDIFRSSDAAPGIVREALAEKDRLGLKTIWMQLSVINDDAAALAHAAGLNVVMDRCPKIEYGRMSGRSAGWE